MIGNDSIHLLLGQFLHIHNDSAHSITRLVPEAAHLKEGGNHVADNVKHYIYILASEKPFA
jgi:hypothetical protein